jgi:hypothetical protein
MDNPPYSKGITPKDSPAAATPMPLAIISASPIRLWFRVLVLDLTTRHSQIQQICSDVLWN